MSLVVRCSRFVIANRRSVTTCRGRGVAMTSSCSPARSDLSFAYRPPEELLRRSRY